eukprot:RCo042249
MAVDPYVVCSYVLTIAALLLFAGYSLGYTHRRLRGAGRGPSLDEFVAARGMMSAWRIGFSYFATQVGAWVVTTTSSYACSAGLLGLSMYALAAGMSIPVVAGLGYWLQRRYPDVLSFSDFMGQRFGRLAQAFTCLVTLFAMSVQVIAEFTSMGALFADFVGTEPYTVIVLVAVLTMTYTAYGGLEVSIVADRLQALACLGLVAVLVGYCAATFRPDFGPLPVDLIVGKGTAGYSSLLAMPACLVSGAIFMEAMWSRVWASADP